MNKILFSKFKEDKYLNKAVIEIQYLAGSCFDPKGKEGQAHFMEHILINPKESAELSHYGVGTNAFTSNELVSFYFDGAYSIEHDYGIRKAYSKIDRILKGEMGRFSNEEIEKERSIIHDEIKRSESDFTTQAFQTFHQHIYKQDHPYYFKDGKKNLGSDESLDGLTREDLQNYFERNIKGIRPIFFLYYEGSKKNYSLLLKDIKKIIKNNKFKDPQNIYPYEKLDSFNKPGIDKLVELKKGDGTYLKVIKGFITDRVAYDPKENLRILTWKNNIGTLAYEASRETGIAYELHTDFWDFEEKEIFIISFSLKNQDVDVKIKTFEKVFNDKFNKYLKTGLKEKVKNYKVVTEIYPLMPITELRDEIYQYNRYGEIKFSLIDLKDQSLKITEKELKDSLKQIITSPSYQLKVVW